MNDQDDIDWAGSFKVQGPDPKQRLAELQARAPMKCKKVKPFAIADLHTAARALAAMRCSKAMVWLWLVHQSRKTGKKTIPVPNGTLAKLGVPRETKRRALKELETAGLLIVEQRSRKTPIATLL